MIIEELKLDDFIKDLRRIGFRNGEDYFLYWARDDTYLVEVENPELEKRIPLLTLKYS